MERLILFIKGAFWGLMIGLVMGVTRFIWQFSYGEPNCGEKDTRPAIIGKVHYLHFGVISFLITIVASYAISLMTKPIPEKYVILRYFFCLNMFCLIIIFKFITL